MTDAQRMELERIQREKDSFLERAFAKWRSLCEQEAAIREGYKTRDGVPLRIVVGGMDR